MPRPQQVRHRPPRPLLVYDGDCRFCAFWSRRWQAAAGGRFDLIAYQEPQVARWFPEIPTSRFAAAVHLVDEQGSVWTGAEAALRARALNPTKGGWLRAYRRLPWLAWCAEATYGSVARNRSFFSWLTRLLWREARRR